MDETKYTFFGGIQGRGILSHYSSVRSALVTTFPELGGEYLPS